MPVPAFPADAVHPLLSDRFLMAHLSEMDETTKLPLRRAEDVVEFLEELARRFNAYGVRRDLLLAADLLKERFQ